MGCWLEGLGRAAFERQLSATQEVSSGSSLPTWPEACSTSQTSPEDPAEDGGGGVVVEVVVVMLLGCCWCGVVSRCFGVEWLALLSKTEALSQKAAEAPNKVQPVGRCKSSVAAASPSKKSVMTSWSVTVCGGVRPLVAPPDRTMRGRAAGRSAPDPAGLLGVAVQARGHACPAAPSAC